MEGRHLNVVCANTMAASQSTHTVCIKYDDWAHATYTMGSSHHIHPVYRVH